MATYHCEEELTAEDSNTVVEVPRHESEAPQPNSDVPPGYLRCIPLHRLPALTFTGSGDPIAEDYVSLLMTSLPPAVELRLRVLEAVASIAGAEIAFAVPRGRDGLLLQLSPRDAMTLLGALLSLTVVVLPVAHDHDTPWLFIGHDSRSNAALNGEAERLRLRPVTVFLSTTV